MLFDYVAVFHNDRVLGIRHFTTVSSGEACTVLVERQDVQQLLTDQRLALFSRNGAVSTVTHSGTLARQGQSDDSHRHIRISGVFSTDLERSDYFRDFPNQRSRFALWRNRSRLPIVSATNGAQRTNSTVTYCMLHNHGVLSNVVGVDIQLDLQRQHRLVARIRLLCRRNSSVVCRRWARWNPLSDATSMAGGEAIEGTNERSLVDCW